MPRGRISYPVSEAAFRSGPSTRFIELAGEINTVMPHYVVERVAHTLNERTGRGLRGAKVLVLGVAYKKNVEDTRESPAFKLFELLEKRGAMVDLMSIAFPLRDNIYNSPVVPASHRIPPRPVLTTRC